MRKLAHVETIIWKRPIDGANRIELVGVLGWQCIAKKDEFKVGDKCVYIEIDSLVDKDNPDFEFLEPKKFKIKTMKMRGVLSQGIVFPTSILHSRREWQNGDDVTDLLKIKHVDEAPSATRSDEMLANYKRRHKKIFKNRFIKWLMRFEKIRDFITSVAIKKEGSRKRKYDFPSWIAKTDEQRIQNVPSILKTYHGTPMIVTEKIDGTSSTFFLEKSGNDYEFGVCSRNIYLKGDPKDLHFYYGINPDTYLGIADTYNIRATLSALFKKLKAQNTIVLQGEIIGEAIQDNKYGIKGTDFYGFNLIVDGKKVSSVEAKNIVSEFGIKWVPILDEAYYLPETVDEILSYADGTSHLCNTLREGVVIRDADNTVSFKCISNKFLLKHKI